MIDDNMDPVKAGLWEPIKYRFKHLPIHLALLHIGKVLAFGGSGNDENHLNNPLPAEIFEPDYHENGTDTDNRNDSNHRVYEISNEGIVGDIFCSGHAFLPNGQLIIAGGTHKYDGSTFGIPIPPFSGLEHSYIFDPIELKWNRLGNMKNGRWYPSCIMLSDGRVLVMAGLSKGFPWAFLKEVEMYSPEDVNGWQKVCM